LDRVEKVKIFAELYELITYYYEFRDQPVDKNFNYFEKVEKCCTLLDLDFNELKKEFKLKEEL